VDLSQEEVAE
jgi:hypothetical protein